MTTRQQTPTSLPAAVMNRAVATRLASVLLAVIRKDAGDGSLPALPASSPPVPVGQPASPPAMIPVTVTVMVPSGLQPVTPTATPTATPTVAPPEATASASAPVPAPGPFPGEVPTGPVGAFGVAGVAGVAEDPAERPVGADAFDRLVADHARANPGGPMPAWVMQSGVAHQDIWNKARAEAAMSGAARASAALYGSGASPAPGAPQSPAPGVPAAGIPLVKMTDAEASRIASERVRGETRDPSGRWMVGGAGHPGGSVPDAMHAGANRIGAVRDARRIAATASDLASRLVALRPPDHTGRVHISHPEHLALSRLARAERGLGPGGFTHQTAGQTAGKAGGGVLRGTLPSGLPIVSQGASAGPVPGPFHIRLPRGYGDLRTGYQPVYPANPVNQLLLSPELRDRTLEQHSRTDRQQRQFHDAERRFALGEAAHRDASAFRLADDTGALDAHPDSEAYHATVRPGLARQALVDAGYGLDRPGAGALSPVTPVTPVVTGAPMTPMGLMGSMGPVAPVAILPSLSGGSSSPLIAVPLARAGSSSAPAPASPGGGADDPSVRAVQSGVDAATVLRSSQQVSREAADAAAGAYPAQVLAEWNRQVDSRWQVGTARDTGDAGDPGGGADAAQSLTDTLGSLYDMLQTAHVIGSRRGQVMAASGIRHAVPDDAVADALAGSLLDHPASARHDSIQHAMGQHLRARYGINPPRRDRSGDRVPRVSRNPRAVTGGNVLDAAGATALAHALLGNGGSGLPA